MTISDDSQLLGTFVRNGSPDAFRGLVDRHINLVYGAARRQTHDSHYAEDITQAVFIVLAQRARSVPSAASRIQGDLGLPPKSCRFAVEFLPWPDTYL